MVSRVTAKNVGDGFFETHCKMYSCVDLWHGMPFITIYVMYGNESAMTDSDRCSKIDLVSK